MDKLRNISELIGYARREPLQNDIEQLLTKLIYYIGLYIHIELYCV